MAKKEPKPEPKLVQSMFLKDGDQVCIWSDGAATLVNRDTGDVEISVRKAKRLMEKAQGIT